jgi:hypothetical protein
MRSSVGGALGVLLAVAGGALGGCAMDAADAIEQPAAGPAGRFAPREGTEPCPDVVCGMNSPVIDTLEFHELSLQDKRNAEGFAIQAINGKAQLQRAPKMTGPIALSYDLQVKENHITGVRGDTVISGQALLGAQLQITNGSSHYVLQIQRVRELPFVVGAAGQVGAYQLEWAVGTPADHGAFSALCSNVALLEHQVAEHGGINSEFARQELLGMDTSDAVVFEGDRVSTATMTMADQADNTWFNFGCASHTLAKLLLTRNTVNTQDPALAQPQRQRQATLKLLVADYCGNGTPLTVAGQVLAWQGDAMSFHPANPQELEARWDDTGAVCLNVPRLVHPSSSLVPSPFKDIRAAIATTCAAANRVLPSCDSPGDVLGYFGALRVSANP